MHEFATANSSGAYYVRVCYLPFARTVQELREASTLLHNIVETLPLTYDPSKAVAFRATREQLDLTDWLIRELETPDGTSYLVPGGGTQDVVRVFGLDSLGTAREFHEDALRILTTVKTRGRYIWGARRVALRGAMDQISLAEQMIRERP